jgi:tape measure domain-containing protein
MTAEAKIRISADAAKALTEINRLAQQMGKLARETDSVAPAARGIDQAVARIGSTGALRSVANDAQGLQQQFAGLRNAAAQLAGAVAGIAGGRELLAMSDSYVGLTGRLKVATGSQDAFNASLQASDDLATAYQQSLAALGGMISRTVSAITPLGGEVQQAKDVTEALLASLRLTGATSSEATSAIGQLSQALGSGTLSGEEFKAMAESAPALLAALAKGMNVPVGALKELGSQGRITTSAIVSGLSANLPELRSQAAQIPTVVGGAVTLVDNALLKYVGTSEYARAATTSVISVLVELSKNIETVATVLAGLAAVAAVAFISKMTATGLAASAAAAQKLILAAAARSVAAEMGVAAVASGSFAAAIMGPAGLVVALGALALGWMQLERAKNQARDAAMTEDDLLKQRQAVQAQVDELKGRMRKGGMKESEMEGSGSLAILNRDLAKLDGRLDAMRKKREAAQAAAAPKGGNPVVLQDPATIQATESEFKTRQKVEQEFADKRKAYVIAKDREIAAARSKGAIAQAEQLEAQKLQVLQKMESERARVINGQAKAADQVRFQQAKDLFDAEAALRLDGIERAAAANQQAFDDGLRGYQQYMAERARLEDAATNQQIAQLRTRLAAEQSALAANQGLARGASTPSDRARAEETLARQRDAIARTTTEITQLERNLADQARVRSQEEARIVDRLRAQREQIEQMLLQATNGQTAETIGAAVRDKYRAALQELFVNEQETEPLLKLIDVETERGRFELLQREFQQSKDQLAARESAVQGAIDSGDVSLIDGEREILRVRQASAEQLERQAKALQAQADKLAQVAGSRQPGEDAQAAQAQQDIKSMLDMRTEMERTAKSSAISGLSAMLRDTVTTAKTAGQALRDMVAGFAQSMLDVLSKRLADQLVNQFISAADSMSGASSGGGGGGFLAAVGSVIGSIFHEGGVIGQGSGPRRALPASAWALAPRYHSGGVIGLRPNERPIIAEVGEEMLRADDPRHVNNGGRSMGGVVVNNSVSIQGGDQGDAGARDAASSLVGMMNQTIDDWAVKQSRPGGFFGPGRR